MSKLIVPGQLKKRVVAFRWGSKVNLEGLEFKICYIQPKRLTLELITDGVVLREMDGKSLAYVKQGG